MGDPMFIAKVFRSHIPGAAVFFSLLTYNSYCKFFAVLLCYPHPGLPASCQEISCLRCVPISKLVRQDDNHVLVSKVRLTNNNLYFLSIFVDFVNWKFFPSGVNSETKFSPNQRCQLVRQRIPKVFLCLRLLRSLHAVRRNHHLSNLAWQLGKVS